LNTDGTRQPFFFLHAATEGEAFYSEQLGRMLGPDQPYHSLAPLGLDGSEVPATISEIAQRYLGYVREHQPTGPYWLGGFCMAGPVAFELARQLRAENQPVGLVVVIDTRLHNVAPHARLAERVIQMVGRGLGIDTRARMEAFLAARWLAGASWPAHADSEDDLAEAIRQHYYRAGIAYVPHRADFPLTRLRTSEERPGRWCSITPEFSEQVIAGNHESCVTDEIQSLAVVLSGCLQKARTQLAAPRVQNVVVTT
jgi:thioesterase domain-containing protein